MNQMCDMMMHYDENWVSERLIRVKRGGLGSRKGTKRSGRKDLILFKSVAFELE